MLEHPGRNHVLVVEDNFALACKWSQELEDRGYETTHCNDIESAFQSCAHTLPDAIVLDAFFRESCTQYEGSGGMVFCSKMARLLTKVSAKMPFIMGVSGAIALEGSADGAFAHVPEALMPVRMQKPITGAQIADCLDEAKMQGVIKEVAQLDSAF